MDVPPLNLPKEIFWVFLLEKGASFILVKEKFTIVMIVVQASIILPRVSTILVLIVIHKSPSSVCVTRSNRRGRAFPKGPFIVVVVVATDHRRV